MEIVSSVKLTQRLQRMGSRALNRHVPKEKSSWRMESVSCAHHTLDLPKINLHAGLTNATHGKRYCLVVNVKIVKIIHDKH